MQTLIDHARRVCTALVGVAAVMVTMAKGFYRINFGVGLGIYAFTNSGVSDRLTLSSSQSYSCPTAQKADCRKRQQRVLFTRQ
jgi:hypothetical protein